MKVLNKNVEKYYNDEGQVGVIVSGGFGAGWSTWNREIGTFLIMDKTLVEMCLSERSSSEVGLYLEGIGVEDFYLGGWGDCSVYFLDKGTHFIIDEYDGSESIQVMNETNWSVA